MTSLIGSRAGQKLGNYQLRLLIGQGSFAEVYLGEHTHLKTQAAIKVLHTHLAKEDQERFLNEARTIAALKHPNILSILEFGMENGVPFLVMDYAPNGSLRQRYSHDQRPTPIIILPHLKQVAGALQYAHQEHIIHRDIKPENMLLGSNNEVLLADFGIALGTQSSRVQSMQDIAGTVAYMAPEMLQGQPCPASDQYALGIVLYEWLSGSCPFQGSFTEIASQHVLAPPLPIKAPAVSPEVETVIFKALAKEPGQRFERVQAFVEAFEHATLEVEGTFRAGSGWLPPSVYPLRQTVSTIADQATLRKDHLPLTIADQATLRKDHLPTEVYPPVTAPGELSETIAPRKRPSRVLAIALAVMAFLVATSGLVFLFNDSRGLGPQEQARATALAWQGRYEQVTGGKPFFSDPLSQNVNGWGATTNQSKRCLFKDGAFHVSALTPYTIAQCPNSRVGDNLGNIAYQVQMTIVQGNEGGVVFRLNSAAQMLQLRSYFFSLNTRGVYTLWAVHTGFKTLLHRSSAFIKTGQNQSNLITVIAQGKQITLYINKHYVDSIIDTSSTTGHIGLYAESLPDTTEVVFSNLQVWRL
jgi:eukaryotic-like serine/threonine-protein kinase